MHSVRIGEGCRHWDRVLSLSVQPGPAAAAACGAHVQVDPYVKANIREARASRTKTLHNTNKPVWNETFSLIVDEPQVQSITFNVMDDDLGAFDDVSCS